MNGIYDSWKCYEKALGLKNYGIYLPSPTEIDQRIFDMKWMEKIGIDARLINSVMIYNEPSIELIWEMADEGMSADEIWDRLKWFMLENVKSS